MSPGIRVLVVDDARLLCMSLGHVLRREGHVVDPAASAAEAFELLERHRYDLVLTDVDLPDRDAARLLRRVRALHPGARVVAMTAAGGEAVRAAIQAGAEAVLRKPFELSLAVEEARLAALVAGRRRPA